MKISVISDTHDNIWKLDEAIPYIQKTDCVLHCGDLISPFMVSRLAQGVGELPIHMVWGNNEGDRLAISKVADQFEHFALHGEIAHLVIDELRIAINHYPEIALDIAKNKQYDLVCYGHNHIAKEESLDTTLLLNPGELMGLKGKSTFVIFDTETKVVEWIEL